ncbi:hypothetical protein EJ110_NYTH29145, partial [Nymphaea thermarum]
VGTETIRGWVEIRRTNVPKPKRGSGPYKGRHPCPMLPSTKTANTITISMDSIKLVAEGLAALLALFFICNIWQKKKREARGGLPEPNGSWPVVGHLALLTGTTPLYRTLAALSEKHDPLFSIQLGQRRAIVVSSTDVAKDCFTINDRAFAGRPPHKI